MTFRPRKNRIIQVLKKGGAPIGMQVYTADPTIIEILAYAGFDFYMLDMEHTRVNVETMEHCIRAADAAEITTVIRVAQNDPALISQSVEAGALGVIVPHVKNREDIRKAVMSFRYPPEGELGMCPAIRSANFSQPGWDDYLEHHSKQAMIIPLLEDAEAFDNLEEIFAELRTGVDAVMFGPGDLAMSFNEPGKKVNWNHPFVAEAFSRLVEISKKTGIPVMAVPWPVLTTESAKTTIDKGADICLYSIDQLLFYNLCKEIIYDLRG